jgi:hypothetical protein
MKSMCYPTFILDCPFILWYHQQKEEVFVRTLHGRRRSAPAVLCFTFDNIPPALVDGSNPDIILIPFRGVKC